MHGRCARTSSSVFGESATACMPPCCVPRTPASKLISTRRRFSGWQSFPAAFSKPKNRYLNATWISRKNFGIPPSPASAATSNPTKESGSQRKPSTLGSGSSSCRFATLSSRYATIWRCGLGHNLPSSFFKSCITSVWHCCIFRLAQTAKVLVKMHIFQRHDYITVNLHLILI